MSRLDARGRDHSPGGGVPEALRVGFTGHEQEDAVGLVINARLGM
ncbi:MAG: hypothetical protein OHK0013_20230 [Sandaracinaceae bacterium]